METSTPRLSGAFLSSAPSSRPRERSRSPECCACWVLTHLICNVVFGSGVRFPTHLELAKRGFTLRFTLHLSGVRNREQNLFPPSVLSQEPWQVAMAPPTPPADRVGRAFLYAQPPFVCGITCHLSKASSLSPGPILRAQSHCKPLQMHDL